MNKHSPSAHSKPRLLFSLAFPIAIITAILQVGGYLEQGTTPVFLSVVTNPIDFPSNNRMVPGHEFKIGLADVALKDNIQQVTLQAGTVTSLEIRNVYIKPDPDNQSKYNLIIPVPEWQILKTQLIRPRFFSGMFSPHDAILAVTYLDNISTALTRVTAAVQIPEPLWAWAWGILAVALSTVAGWALYRTRRPRVHIDEGRIRQIIKFPLRLTLTPDNRYSLSLAQVVIWTYVTVFGLTFVWWMTKTYMDITPQVLMLLGIGGATAAASKLQTVSRLQNIDPALREVLWEDRKPSLSDLITTTDGKPSVVKFQMMFFTVLIAGTVLVEIISGFAFPLLSDGLVALMGISSAVYLGSNLSKSVSDRDLTQAVQAFMAKFNALKPEQKLRLRTKQESPRNLQAELAKLKEIVSAYLQ
jgi:hypothetical protein